MTTTNQRLLVCQLVAGKKDRLFGKFSNSLTNKEKAALWEEIRKEAVAGGATNLAGKDGAYVRDSIWGGARRDAMKKRDIADVSGKGAVNFTQVDNLVLDIVGRDSPAVTGMNVGDTEEGLIGDEELEGLAKKDEEKEEMKPEIKPSIGTGTPATTFNRMGVGNKSRGSPMIFAESDLDIAIKKAKLQLLNEQIEGQRIANERSREELFRSRSSSGGNIYANLGHLGMHSAFSSRPASSNLGMPSAASPRPSSVFTPIHHTDPAKFEEERRREDQFALEEIPPKED